MRVQECASVKIGSSAAATQACACLWCTMAHDERGLAAGAAAADI